MATNIDFIVKNGLQVATTATVNGVNVLANDYATLLSARSNDYSTYTTLQGEYSANDFATWTDLVSKINTVQDNVGAGASGYEANDYLTYTTLVSEYQANDFVTFNAAKANDYSTYTTLQGEFAANDVATYNAAKANDYSTYTTLQDEFAANDFATFNAAKANDYLTYTTLQGEFAANDLVTFNAAKANDYLTYTTLQGEFEANDVATYNAAKANDYSTYTTLQGEFAANDLVTFNAAKANDYLTYTTLQGEFAANDLVTFNAAKANDFATFNAAKANDYLTYTTLQGEFAANDVVTYNAAKANDFATFNAAKANDHATYTTLQDEFEANDVATINSALANDYSTYTTLVSEYNANDYTTFTTLQSAYRANDYTTWSGLNSFATIKANSSITLTAGDGLSGGGNLTTGRTFAVDATVVRTSGNQSIAGEKTFTDSVVVEGDLTVNGNVTTVSSTNLEVTDRFIQLASNATGAPSADVGIYLNRGAEGNSAVYYDETNNYFALVDTFDPASNSVVSPTNYSNLKVEHLVVNSTDLVTNLNADLLDNQQGSYYLDYTNATNTDLITLDSVTANGNSTTNSIVIGGINVDSGLIYTDTSNAYVGIGTETPKSKLQVEELGLDTSSLTTSATTADQVLDSFAATDFRTAKYLIQIHDTVNNDYHTSEILLIHDGTTAYITEYAIVFNDTSLASFDADISGGNVRLLVTPTNATNTIKVSRSAITV